MKTKTLLLLVMAIWIASCIVISQWPLSNEICEKNEYTNQQECTTHSVILVAFVKIGKTLEHYIGLITALIALFTLGIFIEALDRGKKELRAYIGIKTKLVRRIRDDIFQAVITIENCGKTPAHDVRYVLETEVGSENGPDVRTNFQIGELSGPMPLAPNAQLELRRRYWQLVREDIPRIAVGNLGRRAFAWGRIEYLDIYERRQSVDFRFETREITRDEATGALIGWALSPTKDGNKAS